MTAEQAFFHRTGPTTFEPTEHASGAWSEDDHHFASIAGLVVHELERFRTEHGSAELQLGRVSYDILGRLPMSELTVDVEVLRPGRTIELLQATVTIAGRAVVIARAWYLSRADTADVVGGLEQLDVVPAFGERGGAGETRRTGSDDGDPLGPPGGSEDELGLVCRARVEKARRPLAREGVVETGLVAGDARVDLVGARLGGLAHPLGVGEEGSSQ